MHTNEKVLYIGLGMVIGGVAGYLIGDLLAYKVLEDEYEDDSLDLIKDIFVDQQEGVRVGPTDYTTVTTPTKPELKDIVVTDETEPRIISLKEWSRKTEGFEQITITYYQQDGVYADLGEEAVDVPNELFGTNIHLHFGAESEDPDIVYVRNPELQTDFEIIRLDESYAVQVLGEPLKRKPGRPKGSKNKPKANEDVDTESS